MRRNTLIFAGIALIVSVAAITAFAHGPVGNWGYGGHMMGYWDRGPGYGNLTDDQRNQIETLNRKFFDQTADIRSRLEAKSSELDALLYAQNPDRANIESVQREISDLRSKLDQKRIDYELELRKIDPNATDGYYGHHMGGYGYGHHMGGSGHMMGYGYGGHGNCW